MKKYMIYLLASASGASVQAGKEIELKISLPKAEYTSVQEWAKIHGTYKGVTDQKEYYLNKKDAPWDFSGGFKDTLETVRVRCEQKGDSVCYKYRHLDPTTKKTTHRDEYETKVENGATMLDILQKLGYTEQTVVSKRRETYVVDDTFEVVFDDVDNVGQFIEVELKVSVDNAKVGLTRIEDLIKKIGITQFKQYDRGYIHMIWNPGYDFAVQRNL